MLTPALMLSLRPRQPEPRTLNLRRAEHIQQKCSAIGDRWLLVVSCAVASVMTGCLDRPLVSSRASWSTHPHPRRLHGVLKKCLLSELLRSFTICCERAPRSFQFPELDLLLALPSRCFYHEGGGVFNHLHSYETARCKANH